MTTYLDSITSLQRVCVHIVARARVQSAARFSLRITPGGFGTPDLPADDRRVRVSGTTLLVESDRPGAAAVRARAIAGASLRDLAAVAGVDLTHDLDVGHDTPPLGDPNAPIVLDAEHAAQAHRSHTVGALALDALTSTLPGEATPTLVRLWPEHFDVALDAETPGGGRVNLGVSPGDGYSADPYAYVGPWSSDRPGAPDFWNAPFGAARTLSELGGDPAAVAGFLREGFDRLGAR